jgi:hypothetical protein
MKREESVEAEDIHVSKEPAQLYLDNVRALLRRFYKIIKDYGMSAREHQTFISGFMAAGKILGVVTSDDLKKIMEEENLSIFNMTIEERRKKTKVKMVSLEDEDYLEIPTIMRGGLRVR